MPRAVVVYNPGSPVEVVEVTLGELREDDVLVSYKAAGLCHTDVSVMQGLLPVSTPMIPGHEGAGVVEAVGSAVTHVKPGDHVALSGTIHCGRCLACVRGRVNLCEWGLPKIFSGRQPDEDVRAYDAQGREILQWSCIATLSEQAIVPGRSVIPIPDDVPFEVAALIGCGVLTGAGAVFNRTTPHAGSSVVVFGAGGVGLNVIQASRLVGAAMIIAVDPSPMKRDLAISMGATDVVDPGAGDVAEQVRALTGGRGADYAFECVGQASAVRNAWDSIHYLGVLTTIGVPPDGQIVELPAVEMWATEKTLRASLFGSNNPLVDIPNIIELYRKGRLKVDELVTRRYSLDQINDAIEDLEASRNARGVIMM